jgi:hypothetical protein
LGFTTGLRGDRPAVKVVIDCQLANDLDFFINIVIKVHGILIEKLSHKLAEFLIALGRLVGRKEDGVLTDNTEESLQVAAVHRFHHVLGNSSDCLHL